MNRTTLDVVPKVFFLTLSSAATFRGGLVSALEMGLSRFELASFPGVISPVMLAMLEFAHHEIGNQHEITVEVKHDEEVGLTLSLPVTFRPTPESDPSLKFFHVLIQPLVVQVARSGLCSLEIAVDGHVAEVLPFRIAARRSNE